MVKYIWIYCLVLVCFGQAAFAGTREIADSLLCGTIVVGASNTVEKDIPIERLLLPPDSIVSVGLYSAGQREVFEVVTWRRWSNQQIETLYLQAGFSPKAVADYRTFIAILTIEDTLLLPVMGRGIALRLEPAAMEFGTLYIENDDSRIKGLAIYNDGDVAVTLRIGLQNSSSIQPFQFSPDTKIREVGAQDAIFLEVTCSAKDQVIGGPFEFVQDSLALTVGEAGAAWTQYVPLSAQLVAPALDIDTLTFGNVLLGTSHRLPVSITNRSGRVVTLPRVEIESKNGVFQYIDSLTERDLLPGATLVAEVEFRPAEAGETNASFDIRVWLDGQSKVTLKTVFLTGRGFTLDIPTVSTGTMRVKTNEVFQFPVTARFDEGQVALFQNSNVGALQYDFELQLNASIANVSDAKVDSVSFRGADQRIHLTGTIHATALQPALPISIQMRALLGDTDSSAVAGVDISDDSVAHIRWTVPGTDVVFYSTIESGAIVLTDVFIWPNGEKRLINTRKGGLKLDLAPNPVSASGILTISAMGFSNTATIVIYSSLGAEVYRSELTALTPLSKQIRDLNMGVGTYYCRLTSGSNSLVKLLRVE